MSLKRISLYVLVGLMLLVLGPVVFSQPDPSRGSQSRASKSSADFLWNMLAAGKDSINVAEARFPPPLERLAARMKQQMLSFLQKKGITNGIMTRELYLLHREEMDQERQARVAQILVARPELRSMTGGGDSLPPSASPPALPREEENRPRAEDQRPIVYRAGKLPKGLPAWFAQLDTDRDGQVGLYEWKAAGKPISAFLAMDANGDGFLTVEEVLRFEKHKTRSARMPARP
jgi:hypothetical protein